MQWIAIVLAVFLFYRYVDRSHKVFLLKGIAALASGAILIGGAFAAYNWSRNRNLKTGLTIEFQYAEIETPIANRRQYVEKAFQQYLQENVDSVKGIPQATLPLVRSALMGRKYLNENAPDSEGSFSQEELDLAVKKWDRELDAKSGARLAELELGRVHAWTERCKQLHATGNLAIYTIGDPTSRLENSLVTEEAKEELSKSVCSGAMDLAKQLDAQRWIARDYLFKLVNGKEPVKLTFHVCNNRGVPLQSYSFRLKGFEHDRSTPHTVLALGPADLGGTVFNSDIIVEPHKCGVIEWTDKYKLFHRYEVEDIGGVWKE